MKTINTSKTILNENSELLKDFFKDINKYKIYSSEDQIQLAREAKSGNIQSREKLINSNLKFVVTCAKKYVGQGVPLMDLISAGITGLILSIENFNPDKGYKFLSFAVWYIRREILKEIYNSGRTIRYPITYISRITKVKNIRDKFISENKREPSEEELLDLLGMNKKQYNSTIINKSYCETLDTFVGENENVALEEVIPAVEESTTDVFTQESISKILKYLSPKEYTVITKYYGIDGEYNYSIREIAKEMGLCDERIRQIRKSALKKLNERYGNILKSLL